VKDPSAATLAGVGEERVGKGLWWVSACAWGRNRWLGSRRSRWGAHFAWKGNEEDEFWRRMVVVGGEVQRKEKKHSGRPRLYPSGGAGDVDEAVRAKHSSKQLRGQLRGVARGGGACPPCNRGGRARDPLDHCSSPLSPLFCPLAKISQNLN
jgi:hypothetical protein